jgi:hypothetical protein
LGQFVAFWWPYIDLTRFLWCFLGILSKKRVENGILGEKIKDLVFPATTITEF